MTNKERKAKNRERMAKKTRKNESKEGITP